MYFETLDLTTFTKVTFIFPAMKYLKKSSFKEILKNLRFFLIFMKKT